MCEEMISIKTVAGHFLVGDCLACKGYGERECDQKSVCLASWEKEIRRWINKEEMISIKAVAEHILNDFACPEEGTCTKDMDCYDCILEEIRRWKDE